MAFLRWLEKRGAPGGIARWGAEVYRNCQVALGKDADPETVRTIPMMLLTQRYSSFSPGPRTNLPEATLVATNMAKVTSIHDACHLVAFVELCADIRSPAQRLSMYAHYCELISEELARLGFPSPHTGYQFQVDYDVA